MEFSTVQQLISDKNLIPFFHMLLSTSVPWIRDLFIAVFEFLNHFIFFYVYACIVCIIKEKQIYCLIVYFIMYK